MPVEIFARHRESRGKAALERVPRDERCTVEKRRVHIEQSIYFCERGEIRSFRNSGAGHRRFRRICRGLCYMRYSAKDPALLLAGDVLETNANTREEPRVPGNECATERVCICSLQL